MDLEKDTHQTVTGGNIWTPEPEEDDAYADLIKAHNSLQWSKLLITLAPLPGLIAIPFLMAYIGTLH